MIDLLLITDVPRLRKIFSLFTEERDVRLRVATSLEKGAEELVADKPAMVFVQTHLSGLSAEILLMHLKKQLGRRRSRFVLLSPPDQVGEEVLKLYNGHIDTSLDDSLLFQAARAEVAILATRNRKRDDTIQAGTEAADVAIPMAQAEPSDDIAAVAAEPLTVVTALSDTRNEASLEEQGVVYSPRAPLSVYSEFTSSFDSAVSSIAPQPLAADSPTPSLDDWDHEQAETVEQARPKRTTFLLWLAPVVMAVVVVTVLQHRRTPVKAIDVTPIAPAAYAPPAAAVKQPTGEPDARHSDQAVMSAIAENRIAEKPAASTPKPARPEELPKFIPRAGIDKTYGASNPGWERYKGKVTEFKVYREGKSIKAIQVIDRGGHGVPEAFIKEVLRQLTKAPTFVMASTEKKEGYEILRGQVAENLKVVYYRDEKGGRLRAFVVTWQ